MGLQVFTSHCERKLAPRQPSCKVLNFLDAQPMQPNINNDQVSLHYQPHEAITAVMPPFPFSVRPTSFRAEFFEIVLQKKSCESCSHDWPPSKTITFSPNSRPLLYSWEGPLIMVSVFATQEKWWKMWRRRELMSCPGSFQVWFFATCLCLRTFFVARMWKFLFQHSSTPVRSHSCRIAQASCHFVKF